MEKYNIKLKKSAVKELEAVPKNDLRRIINRIRVLEATPRPARSQKLSSSGAYRVRQGHYRIVYRVLDRAKTIEIYKIGHRSDVYRHKIN